MSVNRVVAIATVDRHHRRARGSHRHVAGDVTVRAAHRGRTITGRQRHRPSSRHRHRVRARLSHRDAVGTPTRISDGVHTTTRVDHIVASTTRDRVVASTTHQAVVTTTTHQAVGTVTTHDAVSTVATEQGVRHGAADERVVAVTAGCEDRPTGLITLQLKASGASVDSDRDAGVERRIRLRIKRHLVSTSASQVQLLNLRHIGEISTIDGLVSTRDTHRVGTTTTNHGHVTSQLRRRRKHQHVVISTRINDVIPSTTHDAVSTVAASDRV